MLITRTTAHRALVWLISTSLVMNLTPSVFAQDGIRDIQLNQQNSFRGIVATPSGQRMPDTVVQLKFQGSPVATARTDASGTFLISNVKAGGHELIAGPTQTPVRIWSCGAAPPGACCDMAVVIPEQMPVSGYCAPDCGPCATAAMPCDPTVGMCCAPAPGLGSGNLLMWTTAGLAAASLGFGISNYRVNRDLRDFNSSQGIQANNATVNNPASP